VSDFPTDLTNNTQTYDFLAPWMNDVGEFLNDLIIGDAGVPSYASDPALTPGTPLVWINTTSDTLKFSPDGVTTLPIVTSSTGLTENVQDIVGAMVTGVGGTWTYNDGAGTLEFEVDQQVADLDDVPDSSTRVALTPDERTKLGIVRESITFRWNDVDEFDRLDVVPHSTHAGVDEWTLSTPDYGYVNAAAGDGGYTRRARFTGPGPGASDGGNSRIFYVAKTSELAPSVGGRVRQVMWDHSGTGANNGQAGNVHAMHSIGGGQYKAIVVWHDIAFSNPRVINFNVWTTESTPGGGDSVTSVTGGVNWQMRLAVDPFQRTAITASWCYSGTTYYRLGTYDHGFIVGDSIHVVGPTEMITFAAATITAVTGDVIAAVTLATRNSYAGGPGYVQRGGTQPPFPMVLDSTLSNDGTVVNASLYPANQAPPDFGDPKYSMRWEVPSGHIPSTGQHGICVNHLGLNKYHESAALNIERGAPT
jgi:hypothetical protein